MMKCFQFVWRKNPKLLFRNYIKENTDMKLIYKWILILGFLEIRKWQNEKTSLMLLSAMRKIRRDNNGN
jgi:hypothetical protein